MLKYLSSFCTFYAYSHGLRGYILEILDLIDPEEEYFKERATRVLAPLDDAHQKKLRQDHKSLTDFRDPNDKTKPLWKEEDLSRTLILDDQFVAINPSSQGNLIQSKKFLRFLDNFESAHKQNELQSYQYPSPEH